MRPLLDPRILATGKRPYVLVDLYGGMHALSKLIDDKSVRTKEIRDFLEKDFPPDSLPRVEEAQKLVADHNKVIETADRNDLQLDQLAQLKHSQKERRHSLELEREALKVRQKRLRESQLERHRAEWLNLRTNYMDSVTAVSVARYERRPTGLAGFLAKISGLMLLQKKIHQHQDARKFAEYRKQQGQLKIEQQADEKALKMRLQVQAQIIDRRARALERVDARELAAFERDLQRQAHTRGRGEDGAMPSLTGPARTEDHNKGRSPDLLQAFEKATKEHRAEPPDLTAAFKQASREPVGAGDRSGGSLVEKGRPPEFGPQRSREGRSRDEE